MTLSQGNGRVTQDAIPPPPGRTYPLLLHEQLVGKRLYINSLVRFLVVDAIVCGALAAKYVLGVDNLDMASLMLLAAFLCLFNIGMFLFARRHKELEGRASVHRVLMGAMHLSIAVDFIFLTVALWLIGGAKSPFQAFYLLHVVLAAALLSPPATYAHAAFGYALFAGLATGEWLGVIPGHFPLGIVNSPTPPDGRFILTVLIVQALLMVLTVYLVTGLTGLLRRGEQQLRAFNEEVQHVSRLQRDFLHITLHDLKSPVNAATMLLQSMQVAADPPLTEQQSGWVDRVRVRLGEATGFLHDIEVLAMVDADVMAKHSRDISIDVIVRHVATENEDLLRSHNHLLRLELAENLPQVHGIERLLHEAVANLITNADKYTPANGTITVSVRHHRGIIRIEVKDTGIGIAPEDQARLFQGFVRIRRKDTAVGDVAGSGLGLSIVRRVVEAHGGRVGVLSELDKGSTFFIELPVSSAGAVPAPPMDRHDAQER